MSTNTYGVLIVGLPSDQVDDDEELVSLGNLFTGKFNFHGVVVYEESLINESTLASDIEKAKKEFTRITGKTGVLHVGSYLC